MRECVSAAIDLEGSMAASGTVLPSECGGLVRGFNGLEKLGQRLAFC
jgi:hypothetical protein